ncbi:MAG: 50S ribosomal protein L11 methyltransferase [Bdellovibrionales bacterium]
MNLDPAGFIQTQTQILSPSIIPEIKLHLAAEFTPLWQLTEDRLRQTNVPPPFWAVAWPGGQGAARYILDNPAVVKDRRVVDFAAGSGLIAIAAMKAGAKSARAVDIDPLALDSVRLNARLNNVVVDISEGLDLTKPYTKADVIIAGDICYQQAMSTTLIRFLRLCVEKGTSVYLSDPGRAYLPHEGLVKIAAYDVPTSRDIEDKDARTATVWKMEMGKSAEEA